MRSVDMKMKTLEKLTENAKRVIVESSLPKGVFMESIKLSLFILDRIDRIYDMKSTMYFYDLKEGILNQ